jgi:hypothetical protein
MAGPVIHCIVQGDSCMLMSKSKGIHSCYKVYSVLGSERGWLRLFKFSELFQCFEEMQKMSECKFYIVLQLCKLILILQVLIFIFIFIYIHAHTHMNIS